jgi:hypothetical protein
MKRHEYPHLFATCSKFAMQIRSGHLIRKIIRSIF